MSDSTKEVYWQVECRNCGWSHEATTKRSVKQAVTRHERKIHNTKRRIQWIDLSPTCFISESLLEEYKDKIQHARTGQQKTG